MRVINLSEHNSLLNQYLKEIRSVDIQHDSLRFRRNIERIGEVMALEVSRELTYASEPVQTPLGVAEVQVPTDKVVLATVLRAGLPLHQGFLNMFDRSAAGRQDADAGGPDAGNGHVDGGGISRAAEPRHPRSDPPMLHYRDNASRSVSARYAGRPTEHHPLVRRH